MESAIAVDDTMEILNPHSSPNPLRCPPPAPLNQMSPERINQQRIPQSPSLHSYLADHDRPRTRDSFTSDVQSKVAFLNNLTTLSTQSSPTRPRRTGAITPADIFVSPTKHDLSGGGGTNAAFQRAIMGYEEAQATLASLAADLDRAKDELASRKKRERMLSQRVEDLLEELQAEKEKRARDQDSYTKEIKRCRKETYRAELAVVEARQDLQDARTELKKSQAEAQHERTEKEKARQESFERAYALAGTVGDLEQVTDRLKAVERQKEAAIAEAKKIADEHIAMVEKAAQTEALNAQAAREATIDSVPATAAEEAQERTESVQAVREAIKSQWSHHSHTLSDTRPDSANSTGSGTRITSERPTRFQPPKVPSLSAVLAHLDYFSRHVEGEKPAPAEEIKFLKQELVWAKTKHREDADLIHLMHMQCQFKACPCRLAESNGERFVHDAVYDAKMQQQHASKKRKIAKEMPLEIPPVQATKEVVAQSNGLAEDTPLEDNPQAHHPSPIEGEPAKLPPPPTPELLTRALESPLLLAQATEIPLPDPLPMELDFDTSTTEPTGHTAQLEEITQVLVAPTGAIGSTPFSFSTSLSSNANAHLRAPITAPPSLRHTQSATPAVYETTTEDLFDLSPPKQLPPRRPSTAMGILTLDSPVRLVPESPRSARSLRDSGFRAIAHERNHMATQSSTTTITRVALKDTPSQATLHRRAQSKPNLRSHSPLVTATIMSHHHDESDIRSTFVKETSASPAASTVFPMTPVHKHSRSMHNLAQHAQMQANLYSNHMDRSMRNPPQPIATTTTTTTRVPLRDTTEPEEDDVFSPAHPDLPDHARTENLNIRMNHLSHDPTIPNHPHSTSRTTSTSTSATLPGTPISREAALAQIRARRDRARSVNLKRSLDEGSTNNKENASVRIGGSPTKTARPMVVNGMGGKENGGLWRSVREISQASAPGRIGG